MRRRLEGQSRVWWPIEGLAIVSGPAAASVRIESLVPALASSQPAGATPGSKAKFNVAPRGGALATARGNYYFLAAIVVDGKTDTGYDIQIQPTPGTDTGTETMNISGPASYRSLEMPNLYNPPIT